MLTEDKITQNYLTANDFCEVFDFEPPKMLYLIINNSHINHVNLIKVRADGQV